MGGGEGGEGGGGGGWYTVECLIATQPGYEYRPLGYQCEFGHETSCMQARPNTYSITTDTNVILHRVWLALVHDLA